MNTNNVKKYAPKARKAFIEAMSKQAAKYGITKKKIEPAEQKGDLVLIGDRPFPASVIKPRERLVKRIEQQGFDQVMEHVAYSWFNRLCAIRYMERKGFLDHGRRVLSAADGSVGVPQILEECLDVELPGLDQTKVRELKLDGTKDEELYRELLLAQCHALHQAMPFLLEAVADESELLLPENRTKTDSLIRDLVASVPDEDWDHIEIIGWLYQFYISEKKDQVIGKVVKSEDIPAATQLFTPNWIVQYLVQNSVGRQWLQMYPDSPLKEKMPYYIEPAEQTPEVQAQLAAITPSDIAPESIKVLDPACGSGHILVEAYKVLKAIYEERGYRTRDIPQLILENNLFGLDIDDRAGQLAGFALMMLVREDDRRIFSRHIRLNVLSLQESANVNLPFLWKSLNLTGEWQSGTSQGLFEEEQQDLSDFEADNRYQLLQKTLERFKQAKTFGSLIDVPHEDYEGLKEHFATLCELEGTGDSMQKVAAAQLLPYLHQAVLLAQNYDAVVANPPYMGSKGMNAELKSFAKRHHSDTKADLFSVYIERCLSFGNANASLGLVTPYVWMFLATYEKLRSRLVKSHTLSSLIQLEYNAFAPACIPVCTFTISKPHIAGYIGSYIRLSDFKGHVNQAPKTLEAINNRECGWYFETQPDKFLRVPGTPIAYWLDDSVLNSFAGSLLRSEVETEYGIITGDNEKYLRQWFEVNCLSDRWVPFNKGGTYRKWYGNITHVIDWSSRNEFVNFSASKPLVKSQFYGIDCVTWSDVTSSYISFRMQPSGHLSSNTGPTAFSNKHSIEYLLGFLNSDFVELLTPVLNPTLHFTLGDFGNLPIPDSLNLVEPSKRLIEIAKKDWDSYELSSEFKPQLFFRKSSISKSYEDYCSYWDEVIISYLDDEDGINKIVRDHFNVEKPQDKKLNRLQKVTLNRNVEFQYSANSESLPSFRKCDYIREIVSYSLGCMLGRYSLDRAGLVYARSGNEGFSDLVDEGTYKTFPADDDGIIPLTDQEWFPDDATNRFREFVKVVWGEEQLQENLDFVAESLCLHAIKPKKSETSMDTIRRYLSTQFYKDHLKAYKKRPIYWLFSSGKQKAFECLVYLHRYNEGTLARMRTEYVIPLTAKMATYAQKLENDKEASGSAAEVKRLEKEISQLHKQQAELSEFDEKLRHYADQRISLDLDDGVKANYGKFGDLLAEVKAITGEAPEVNL